MNRRSYFTSLIQWSSLPEYQIDVLLLVLDYASSPWVWICMTLCALASKYLIFLNQVGKHGKFSDKKEIPSDNSFSFVSVLSKIISFSVPKAYFTHMYMVGIISSVLTYYLIVELDLCSGWSRLGIIMFQIQVWRRLAECIFITSFGSSQISIVGYAVGIVHYSLFSHSLFYLCIHDERSLSFEYVDLAQSIIAIVFGIVSMAQFYHHWILFKLKNGSHNNNINRYGFPRGGLFEWVCCPHYLLEILIYLLFFLQHPSWRMFFAFIWVGSNLSVVADNQYQWYKGNFEDEFKKNPSWKRLIPYAW